MCARGLACYPVSPNSACYLPVRCGFGSPSPVPTSPAAPVRRTTSLGGVWYLPSWECAGGEEGLVVTLRSEVSHNPCSTENLRSPSPQQTSCPKSLTDCSSIPPASLDVFSLAPGAFPIPLVQNILIRAPCPGQAHLEKVWEVPPRRRPEEAGTLVTTPTPGASGRQRGTSVYCPGESKGEEVAECRGRRTRAPGLGLAPASGAGRRWAGAQCARE